MRRLFRLSLGRRQIARDVDEELAFHLAMRAGKLSLNGLAPADATAEALRQFGDLGSVRNACIADDTKKERSVRLFSFLSDLRHDIIYAVRTLRRNAGFAAVVIASLALGIGANASIFSLVDAVLLRPLSGVTHPRDLVVFGDASRMNSWSTGSGASADLFSYPAYSDLRDQTHTVSGLLATGPTGRIDVTVGDGSTAEHPSARYVSANYFSVLGVSAEFGQVFLGTEDRSEGAAPVAVISDQYWARRFGRAQSAVGRTVTVNGAGVTIIGVAGAEFRGEIVGQSADIWFPISMQPVFEPHDARARTRATVWLLLMGRLQPGVSMESARTELLRLLQQSFRLNGTGARNGAAQPVTEGQLAELKLQASSGERGLSRVRTSYEKPLVTLMAGVGLLLVIICVNVANLLLARTIARSREITVRLALGAGRGRIVRQLFTESVVLASVGIGLALLVASWGSRLLLTLAADGGSLIPLDTHLNLSVLGFVVAVAAAAVLAFGLTPALRATRLDLGTSLRSGARSVGAGNATGRPSGGYMLVSAQVAVSTVLLVSSALLVRNLRAIELADVGLDRDHLLVASADAAGAGYRGDRLVALAHDITGRLAALPGVSAASYSSNGIFSGYESAATIQVPGFVARTQNDSTARIDAVGPGYVNAIGGRLLAGRDINDGDRAGALTVALVNESFAKFYFPSRSAVGQSFKSDDSTSIQIVGVIADVRDHSLAVEPIRRFYISYEQPQVIGIPRSIIWEIRTSGDPVLLAKAVRRAMLESAPLLPIYAVSPVASVMRNSVRERRLLMRVASGFGVLALLLSAVGLYGVMTYAVTRRTSEIGVRVALGATRANILRMIMGDAARVVMYGVVLGTPLALATSSLMRSQLDRVSLADPVSLVAALAVLSVAALIAAIVPALRASRVEPIAALRTE